MTEIIKPIVIVLPFASPSQNELQRWHWGKKSKWQKELSWRIALQMRALGVHGMEAPDHRVLMEVTRRGPRTLDYGNLVGGFKPLLDVLVRACLMRDDSPEWLSDVYVQELGRPTQTVIRLSRARKVT